MNEVIKKIKEGASVDSGSAIYKDSNLPFITDGSRIHYDKDLDKVIVNQGDEGMTESIANDWEVFCRDNDIPINKILVLHNNPMVEREFLYSFDYYFMECRRLIKKITDYGIVNYDIEKEKIYNCLNNNIRSTRTFIFDGLKERKLLQYGYVSYIEKGVHLPSNIKDTQIKGLKINEKTNELVPLDDWRWPTLVPDVISKTYFNVVTECGLQSRQVGADIGNGDGCFITEKTCKALITEPFMVVGNCEILKYLKERGFETYPELFDESYDLIENPRDRLNLILDEVERLCNMNKNELEKIYKSVLWKIEHNRKRMLNFEDDEYIRLLKFNYGGHNLDDCENKQFAWEIPDSINL